jgi:chromosomal replication initiator protein
VITRIAQAARHSVRELEGVFNRVILHSRASHHPITVEVIDRSLNRVDSPRPARSLTPAEVIKAVSGVFNITEADMTGKKRTAKVSAARQVAMLLLRELTDIPLTQIGDALGGRQHSTVISGIKRAQQACDTDPDLCAQIQAARIQLVG